MRASEHPNTHPNQQPKLPVLARSGMTVEYDCSDFNELTGFLRWRGTVLPAVLCRPAIWVLLLIHCVLLYMRMRLDLDLGMIVKSDSPDDISKVSTTFLVFFLVYYGGNCYARYYSLYESCMGMAADVQCWVGLTRGLLSKCRREDPLEPEQAHDRLRVLHVL